MEKTHTAMYFDVFKGSRLLMQVFCPATDMYKVSYSTLKPKRPVISLRKGFCCRDNRPTLKCVAIFKLCQASVMLLLYCSEKLEIYSINVTHRMRRVEF